jgi:hypothetical protein
MTALIIISKEVLDSQHLIGRMNVNPEFNKQVQHFRVLRLGTFLQPQRLGSPGAGSIGDPLKRVVVRLNLFQLLRTAGHNDGIFPEKGN